MTTRKEVLTHMLDNIDKLLINALITTIDGKSDRLIDIIPIIRAQRIDVAAELAIVNQVPIPSVLEKVLTPSASEKVSIPADPELLYFRNKLQYIIDTNEEWFYKHNDTTCGEDSPYSNICRIFDELKNKSTHHSVCPSDILSVLHNKLNMHYSANIQQNYMILLNQFKSRICQINAIFKTKGVAVLTL